MDFQRTIAFVVFSLSLLLLWQSWQDYSNPKPANVPAVAAQSGVEAGMPTPDASLASQTPKVAEAGAPQSVEVGKGQRVVVKTDVLTAVVDANGGDIRELTLHKYRQNDNKHEEFKLFEERAGRYYFAQSGFTGNGLPSHKSVYTLPAGELTLKPGEDSLRLDMTAVINGVEVIKTYVFHRNSYLIDVDYNLRNQSETPVSGHPYFQLLRHGQAPEGESAFMYTFTGPAFYTDQGKYQKVVFGDIAEGKADFTKLAEDGWVGMVQHHFLSAWLGHTADARFKREYFTQSLGSDLYTAGMILPETVLEPGKSAQLSTRLYAGPQEQENLKALAPGLEHVVDYGWLTVLAYPLFVLLNWLQNLVVNWGVAIILLTVLIKLAFYPLSAASYKSMAQMRKLAPRLQNLKERYGDDRQKMHEQMMKIYKEEKINPLGGCLPILVQIPVFIALYWVLMGAVELRQAPFALWITDLSEPDPYYILPLVMAVTMFIQTKLSPAPPDPVQAKVMMFMPLVFSVFFFFFPAGLVLYWLVNNVLSILQQWRINTVIGRADHAKPAK